MTRARPIKFYKMHSLGNDFMVLDRVTQPLELSAEVIAQWGDRRTGVGFDQLLVIDPPTVADADFGFGIFNSDGSSAEQCGNGTRCVTLLARQLGLTKKTFLTWQSAAGTIHTTFSSPQQIETTMTVPQLDPEQIPFSSAAASACLGTVGPASHWQVEAHGQHYDITPVSMGNPHGVIFVDNVFDLDVPGLGEQLTRHPVFPQGANIGFCQVVDPQFMRLRVFERGAGETRACGSGACAAVVAARLHQRVNERVKVSLPGGKLRIAWSGPGETVTMVGDATLVYQGELAT